MLNAEYHSLWVVVFFFLGKSEKVKQSFDCDPIRVMLKSFKLNLSNDFVKILFTGKKKYRIKTIV